MNKKFSILFLLVWMLVACAGQAQPTEQPPSSYPNDDTSIPGLSSEMRSAESAAITALSGTLNLPPGQITLISTESVTWPDGCLGVQREGMMCTQALVEGYRIILEAGDKQYEMHSDLDGSAIILATNLPTDGSIENVVIAQLANNLGLNQLDISIVSSEEFEFADTCLGVAMQDVMCAEVITPGHIVRLEAHGIQYEYHASEDGSRIQPATLALTWKREGGIVGFCDSLTIFRSGEVYGNQCKSQPNGTMGTFATLLSTDEKDQFNIWTEEYGSVTLDASDPKGVADGMTNIVMLYGLGKGKPGKPIESEIFTWAQKLFQKLYN